MLEHSKLLDVIHSVGIAAGELRKQYEYRNVDREQLLDFSFRSGEVVIDKRTGQKGVVRDVTRVRVTEVPVSESAGG